MFRFLAQSKKFWIFSLVFTAIAFYYGFNHYYHYLPCSVHSWRQTDGTAIALSYFLENNSFFQPQFLNQMQGDPHTVGEFPLLYYLAAQLFRLFGPEDGLFRLLNLLIFAGGCYALFHIGCQLIKDEFIALCIPVLLFSSPVIAYYSFNFLPDPPALGLALMAWPAYLRFQQKGEKRYLYLSMLLLLLAGLIKVIALISYGVMICISLLHFFGTPSANRRLTTSLRTTLPAFLLVPLGVGLWYFWAKGYNAAHESTYFLARIEPIWSMSSEKIAATFRRFWKTWLWDYFSVGTHLLLLLAAGALVIWWRQLPKRVIWGIMWSVLGSIAVMLLWFRQFFHHDYYIITLMISAIALLLGGGMLLTRKWPRLARHWGFRLFMLVFIAFNLHQAKEELNYRYTLDGKYMKSYKPIYQEQTALQAFLQDIGVQKEDLIISVPDESPNTTLYYLQRGGWTEFNNVKKWTVGSKGKAFTQKTIEDLVRQGARYLVVHDAAYLKHKELQPVLKKQIGVFKNQLFVFDIRGI